MSEERAKRKLAAVFSADVKGYSRLMSEDEAGTIKRIKERRVLMTKLIQNFSGRVVDDPGDNLLAEFSSVVDAIECAVKIQKELAPINPISKALPPIIRRRISKAAMQSPAALPRVFRFRPAGIRRR